MVIALFNILIASPGWRIYRPQIAAAFGEPDAAGLAAAHAYALAKNHGFSDGNKRTAGVVARLFLRVNGVALKFGPAEAVAIMRGVAGGTVAEAALALWFRERIVIDISQSG